MYRIDNYINEDIPLPKICYVKLTAELRKPKKGLSNTKKNDQKCFLWCHVRHINPVKTNPERITREDEKLVNSLNYDGIDFAVGEKDFSKIETKNEIYINVLCYENRLTFAIYISNQKIENLMDLLLVIDGNKSHYVYINDFNNDLCFTKRKIKTKNTFVKVFYSALVVKMYWHSIKKFVWALMVHNL